ncbi:Ig-like domain-containing protein, partial [Aeromonas salmonicida]|uniref:Ig-like domain-containing protein n=1 Tax=Aeromonas salmonicida TaxID=645 RepID=UPI002796E034
RALNAHVVLSDGQTVAIESTQVSWASGDTTLASVNEQGMVTGLAEGNVTLTATLKRDPTKQATVQVTVLPATVDVLELSPPAFKVVAGLTTPLSAQAVLSDGRKLPLMAQEVSWHLDNTAYALVDDQGRVTGVAEGQVTLTATLKHDTTKQAIARGDVLPAMVEQLQILPTPLKVIAGNQLKLSLKAIYSDGREADVQATQVSWHSSVPEVMTVDANGVLRGLQSGNAALTATLLNDMAKTVSRPVTVLEPTLSAVTIRPEQLALLRGESAQLALYGQFDNGAELALDNVHWHSSAPEIVPITENGELHGLAVGSATITGTVTRHERQWQAQLPVQVSPAKVVLRGSGKSLLFDLPLQPQPLPILEMRLDQDLHQTILDPINVVPPEQRYTDPFQAVDVRFVKDEHGDLRYYDRSLGPVGTIAVRETGSGQLYQLRIIKWYPKTLNWREWFGSHGRKYRPRLNPPEGVALAGLELVDQHGMFRPTFTYRFDGPEYCQDGLCTHQAAPPFLELALEHIFRIYNSTVMLAEMEKVFGDPNNCRADHPDFSECAAWDDPELPYAHYNFLRMGMEGHEINLQSARETEPTQVQGFAVGGAPDINLPRATTAGYIALKPGHTGDTPFHELAHAYGYRHQSGMTYGFANHLDKVCSIYGGAGCGTHVIHGFNDYATVTMPAILMEHQTVANNRVRIRFLRPQTLAQPQQLKLRLLSGQRHDVRLEMVEGSDTVDLVVENQLSSPLYVRAERDGITYVATIKLTKEDMDPRQRAKPDEESASDAVIHRPPSPRYLTPMAHMHQHAAAHNEPRLAQEESPQATHP